MAGTDLDSDGCLVTVDDEPAVRLQSGDRHTFGRLEAGTHIVSLLELAPNCRVDGEAYGPVQVVAGDTVVHAFDVLCLEPVPGKIAYWRTVDGADDIFLIGLDGSPPRRVTNEGRATEPALSPDGAQIAYSGYVVADRDADVFIVNVNGLGRRNVTQHPDYDWEAAWSPGGQRLAFLSGRYTGSSIGGSLVTIGVDGSDPREVTRGSCLRQPDWSPDGLSIAYSGPCGGSGGYDIHVIGIDGSNPVNVSDTAGDDLQPAWSPDGSRIVFSSDRDGDYEIYVMDEDGANVVQLTDNDVFDGSPDWSPGGGWIVFSSVRDSISDLYIMDATGGNVMNLTNDDAADTWPSWSY